MTISRQIGNAGEDSSGGPGGAGASFRRPIPKAPIEPFEIRLPSVPRELDGFTILHLSDPHVGRPMGRDTTFERVCRAVREIEVDLVVLTGDYMTKPGDEPPAMAMLERLASCWRSRLGAFGVFGNHDTSSFARRAQAIHNVSWLINTYADVEGAPLRVVGVSYPEDLLGATLDAPDDDRFAITLAHYPTLIYGASELGIPLVLAGHTHGGQIRVHAGLAPHTSSDLTAGLASGVLRYRDTLCCISRGLGEAMIDLRINCPGQAPLYTLRRGEMAEAAGEVEEGELRRVMTW